MRRVLVVTYDFPPSMMAGAQACAQIARHLPRYGWEPIVLTVDGGHGDHVDAGPLHTFPGRVVRTRVAPHPLSVYRTVKSRLRPHADQTTGRERPLPRSGTFQRWALSLLAVPDIYTGWLLPASLAGLREIRRRHVTHLLSSAPCWTNHLVGLVLARLTGLPWTAHFRDPWTRTPGWRPWTPLSRRVEIALEERVVRTASTVVCVTARHTDLMRRRYPDLRGDTFVTIPNGFDETEWPDRDAASAGPGPAKRNTFVITYVGWLYQRRSPSPLFRALATLINSGDIDRNRIRVELIGWCDWVDGARVRDIAAEHGLAECVNVSGPLTRREMLRQLVTSDLLLLLAEGLTRQIPGKTYEYLRSGRPILALTSEGALADLLRQTGGAWVVDPSNQDGIVTAVREAYRSWKDGLDSPTADAAAVSRFDRRLLAGQFAEVFARGIPRRPKLWPWRREPGAELREVQNCATSFDRPDRKSTRL